MGEGLLEALAGGAIEFGDGLLSIGDGGDEVVALAGAGEIGVAVELLPLDQAIGGYGRLRRGEVTGRLVVVPGSFQN